MNEYKIVNLAAPVSGSDAARLTDVLAVAPGTGINAFLVTPTSANLAAAVTDETGTGALVFNTAPTITNANITITSGSITGITDLAIADGGTGASTAVNARTNLGLVIGTDVQAYNVALASIAGLTTAADKMIYTTASNTYATTNLVSQARSLLADPSGAYVNFLQAGSGTVTRTLQDKAREIVSVSDFTGATDAAKLQAAFDSGATEIHVPASLSIGSAVTSNGNTKLVGNGATITMTGSAGAITVGTGVTRIADLSADIVVGATQFTFATAHGLSVNDVVSIWNPTDYSFGPARSYYREGDMFQVAEIVSSTVVTIYGKAQTAMAAASYQVFKLNGGSFSLEGINIVPSSSGTQTPLFLDGLIGVYLKPKITAGTNPTAIEPFRCYGGLIDTADIRTTVASDSYPITISNSQKFIITNTSGLRSAWHSVALGGRTGNGTVPAADILVVNNILENVASTGIPAADVHGGCKRIIYDGGIFYGASMSGKDITIRNARILATEPSSNNGICVQGSEVVGGTYTLENCEMIAGSLGVSFGSHISLTVSAITSDLRLIIRNCTMQQTGTSGVAGAASLIRLELGTAALTPNILIDIDGLTYIGAAAPLNLLALGGTGTLSAGSEIRISNVFGVDRLVGATNSANYSVRFSGPGLFPGVTNVGDANTTLTRASTRNIVFNTTLTANRTCDLPFGQAGANDEVIVTRTGAGDDYDVTVRSSTSPRLASLGQYEWVRLAFQGCGAGGAWVVTARGSLGQLTGQRTFGDVSAFIELTRTSVFFGRQVNVWNTPFTTDRSVSFDGGAQRGDTLRFVRTAAATGAFNLNVPHSAGTKALTPGTWCDLTHDGSAFFLTAYGAL